MVRAVAALHVPLPWGRVLRRRVPGFGPARSRAVRVRVPGAGPAAMGARRAAADAGGAVMTDAAPLRAIGQWIEDRLGLRAVVTLPIVHRDASSSTHRA